jgi:hypothetical protein
MVQNHMIDALSDRLARDVQIFDSLLKLIPAKFYVMDKSDDVNGSKFQHNKRKRAPKQAIKDATKKAKKAKLDPNNIKSIAELQEEKAKELAAAKDAEEEEVSEEEEEQEESVVDSDDNDDQEEQETEKMDIESGAFSGLDDNESITTESTTTQESGKLNDPRSFKI